MSVTITVHAWWLAVYLLIGVALYLPTNYLAHRQIRPRGPFVIQVIAWPYALWEAFRA